MKIISHRGNLKGPDKKKENTLNQIEKTINKFDCEIDVWFYKKDFYLGHDRPLEKINKKWLLLYESKLWIHAKNKLAVNHLMQTNLNWFWHNIDIMTLTSKRYIWAYPNNYFKNGITVIENINVEIPKYIMGICTDNPVFFNEKI